MVWVGLLITDTHMSVANTIHGTLLSSVTVMVRQLLNTMSLPHWQMEKMVRAHKWANCTAGTMIPKMDGITLINSLKILKPILSPISQLEAHHTRCHIHLLLLFQTSILRNFLQLALQPLASTLLWLDCSIPTHGLLQTEQLLLFKSLQVRMSYMPSLMTLAATTVKSTPMKFLLIAVQITPTMTTTGQVL